jgi:hypothetical protein
MPPMVAPEFMRYYDLRRHWTKKIKPHLADKTLNAILVRDFNKFTLGRYGERFEPGMLPSDFESCDWRLDRRRPWPRYWDYVKHAACHWVVNFALRLASLALPATPWRIVSSQRHSTVWDGDRTLFDFNFQALGVSPQECWSLADQEGRHLAPGKFLKVYLARTPDEDEFSNSVAHAAP